MRTKKLVQFRRKSKIPAYSHDSKRNNRLGGQVDNISPTTLSRCSIVTLNRGATTPALRVLVSWKPVGPPLTKAVAQRVGRRKVHPQGLCHLLWYTWPWHVPPADNSAFDPAATTRVLALRARHFNRVAPVQAITKFSPRIAQPLHVCCPIIEYRGNRLA